MSEVKKTLKERIDEKKMSLEKVDKKIKNLTSKKNELTKELKILVIYLKIYKKSMKLRKLF